MHCDLFWEKANWIILFHCRRWRTGTHKTHYFVYPMCLKSQRANMEHNIIYIDWSKTRVCWTRSKCRRHTPPIHWGRVDPPTWWCYVTMETRQLFISIPSIRMRKVILMVSVSTKARKFVSAKITFYKIFFLRKIFLNGNGSLQDNREKQWLTLFSYSDNCRFTSCMIVLSETMHKSELVYWICISHCCACCICMCCAHAQLKDI
jgi:hypothetical protein